MTLISQNEFEILIVGRGGNINKWDHMKFESSVRLGMRLSIK